MGFHSCAPMSSAPDVHVEENGRRGEYGALRRSNRDNQPVHRGYRLPLATPSPAIPGGTDFYKSVRCSSHQHKVSHTANVQSQRRISAP